MCTAHLESPASRSSAGDPSDLDCAQTDECPQEVQQAPAIDYLAKDYPAFRRLVLDRITQLVPGWQERSAADLIFHAGFIIPQRLVVVARTITIGQRINPVCTAAAMATRSVGQEGCGGG